MSDQPIIVEFGFPSRGAVALVELQMGEAPFACRALLARLPVQANSYHAKWSGNEVFAILPPFAGLVAEGPTTDVKAGDVVLYHHAAGYRGMPWHLRKSGLGDYAELGLFYGSLVRSYDPAGPVAGTRVGRIVEGIEAVARAAQAMRREGFEPMVIRKNG